MTQKYPNPPAPQDGRPPTHISTHDAVKMRQGLEFDILRLIRAFEDETGLHVTDIDSMSSCTIGERCPKTVQVYCIVEL